MASPRFSEAEALLEGRKGNPIFYRKASLKAEEPEKTWACFEVYGVPIQMEHQLLPEAQYGCAATLW